MNQEKKFILTADHIQASNDYIPLADKYRLAVLGAHMVATKDENKAEYIGTDGQEVFVPVAPLYSEKTYAKELFIADALLSKYLNVLKQTKDENGNVIEFSLNNEHYDYYMRSHVIQQLLELKRNKACGTKAKNIIEDFTTFKSMLYTEIKNLLAQKNNPVDRVMVTMQAQSSPEALQSMQSVMSNLANEIDKEKENFAQEINSIE